LLTKGYKYIPGVASPFFSELPKIRSLALL
jgi:hypothetical protein